MKRALALAVAASFVISSAVLDSTASAERRGINKGGQGGVGNVFSPQRGKMNEQIGVGGKVIGPATGGTVVYSTNSVKCGNTIYEVSTGTRGGSCDATRNPGQPTTGTNCVDGNNTAEANCTTGCGTTTGAGSCTIKTAQ